MADAAASRPSRASAEERSTAVRRKLQRAFWSNGLGCDPSSRLAEARGRHGRTWKVRAHVFFTCSVRLDFAISRNLMFLLVLAKISCLSWFASAGIK